MTNGKNQMRYFLSAFGHTHFLSSDLIRVKEAAEAYLSIYKKLKHLQSFKHSQDLEPQNGLFQTTLQTKTL